MFGFNRRFGNIQGIRALFVRRNPILQPLSAAVGFCDVTSANIVGYTSDNTASPVGYKFIAPAFLDCGKTDTSTLNNGIVPIAITGTVPDGSSSAKRIYMQVLDGDGATVGNKLAWKDYTTTGGSKIGPGWYKHTSTSDRSETKIQPGQAVMITFPEGCDNCTIQFNGQVSTEDAYPRLQKGYNFIGNTTPVELSIQDIQLLADEGYEVPNGSTSSTRVYLQVLDEDGATVGDKLAWKDYDKSGSEHIGPGWWKHTSSTATGKSTITIKPGQGFLISGDFDVMPNLKVKIPAPKID